MPKSGVEKIIDVSAQSSVVYNGSEYFLYSSLQEGLNMSELNSEDVLNDANSRMSVDLSAGLSPYMIVGEEEANQIQKSGINSESLGGVDRFNYNLNVDLSGQPSDKYLVILKYPDYLKFFPKIEKENGRQKYFGHLVSTQIVSPADLVIVKVSDLGGRVEEMSSEIKEIGGRKKTEDRIY